MANAITLDMVIKLKCTYDPDEDDAYEAYEPDEDKYDLGFWIQGKKLHVLDGKKAHKMYNKYYSLYGRYEKETADGSWDEAYYIDIFSLNTLDEIANRNQYGFANLDIDSYLNSNDVTIYKEEIREQFKSNPFIEAIISKGDLSLGQILLHVVEMIWRTE